MRLGLVQKWMYGKDPGDELRESWDELVDVLQVVVLCRV
jgi:hypothetical protein